jgi:hypothetical protein
LTSNIVFKSMPLRGERVRASASVRSAWWATEFMVRVPSGRACSGLRFSPFSVVGDKVHG